MQSGSQEFGLRATVILPQEGWVPPSRSRAAPLMNGMGALRLRLNLAAYLTTDEPERIRDKSPNKSGH